MNKKSPCLVMAEVAQAHDGSLGTAHAFVDAVARTGADAIKFQTHYAEAESSAGEAWRVKFSRQDDTRYDYWRRMEFSEAQWRDLRAHAVEKGLRFLSSPFSAKAVEVLRRVGVHAWKVASGELSNPQLFEMIAETQLPIYLSTGMSSWEEIDSAVERIERCRLPYVLLQCTSAYPCPPERVGINVLGEFRQRYGCAVGLSDHSGTIYPALAAATLGAELIEVHVTLSRESFGPDVPSSVTSGELRQLVDGVRFIEKMISHPVNKDQIAQELGGMRRLFTKSIVAEQDLPAGLILGEQHLGLRKPGTGIPAEMWHQIVGKRLQRAVARGEFLSEKDLENAIPLRPVPIAAAQ